jgi:dipeptidyl aminopeptidase/acylaminoacyl peptidase
MARSRPRRRLLAIAFACLTVAPAVATQSTPAAQPLPIEALAALPDLSEPSLSPDGYRIAAPVTVGGQGRIAVWDLRHRETPPRMLSHSNYDIRWLRWAGPNRLLIGVRMTARYSGIEFPVTRIIAMDTSGNTAWTVRMLNTGQGFIGDTVIHVDRDGRFVLVSSQPTVDLYPAVYRIDLATGASSQQQSPRDGVWTWFADSDGVVRLGIDYGRRAIRLYYRSSPDGDLRRIDTIRYPEDDSVIDAVRFIGSDRGIVVTNAVTGRFAVYGYDFANDTRGEAIFEHPTADVVSVITGRTGNVLGVSYEDDRPRIHWIDPDYRTLQATIDRALPGKLNRILDSSADEQRLLLWSSAADDPGTYFIYDRPARRIEPFMSPYGELVDRPFASVRPISFRGRDGSGIPGYLTLPPGREARGLPLILMPHGGPFARDSWAFDPWVQFLASRGYAVLQVNFRGSTGYGRTYVERGHGQWGSGMIDDMEDGVDWLVGQQMVDARRVCILGASYGGYAALWAPIRKPERYRCAVSFAGLSDLSAMLRYDNRRFTATRYARDWRRQVRGGEEDADLGAISPLRQAARISVPLLIAHGERDTNVPPSQSRNLIRALGQRHVAVESVFYPEAGHGFSRPQDSVDFLRRVEAFLARHNPAGATPARAPEAASATPATGVSISPARR